ncbi:MAG TPA: tRNA (guanosine(37)-N1)-methyltransferase TrmD [Bellilinea sp.]|nr:tRNA (guanosine(37)-N1)-methyltransferase TrmD [Bellilinea sp.]
MRFDVFTLLPSVFSPYLSTSILQKAIEQQLIQVNIHDIRDWATDKHHITDEPPFGGGGGMVMKPGPVFDAVESVLGSPPQCPVILLTPQGEKYNQAMALEFSRMPQLALICGRYEGFDERIRQHLVTHEVSIGDFVLTGGELPALMLIDSISRLVDGVLGDPDGAFDDSFASGLLEYPHYTRPADFRGWQVPTELVSGNHALIYRWRRNQALLRTLQRRPDLLTDADLTDEDRKFLSSIKDQNS